MTETITCQKKLEVPVNEGIPYCGDCPMYDNCDHQQYIDDLIAKERSENPNRKHRPGYREIVEIYRKKIKKLGE